MVTSFVAVEFTLRSSNDMEEFDKLIVKVSSIIGSSSSLEEHVLIPYIRTLNNKINVIFFIIFILIL